VCWNAQMSGPLCHVSLLYVTTTIAAPFDARTHTRTHARTNTHALGHGMAAIIQSVGISINTQRVRHDSLGFARVTTDVIVDNDNKISQAPPVYPGVLCWRIWRVLTQGRFGIV
jgi:hypothetical protein